MTDKKQISSLDKSAIHNDINQALKKHGLVAICSVFIHDDHDWPLEIRVTTLLNEIETLPVDNAWVD